jgi:hypothetical protein
MLIGTAAPVAACSCAAFESMKDYATAENAVFTGTAGLQQDRGVPVEVDQWLWGQGAARVVWLRADSFGNEAACGTSVPRSGTKWIWVAYLPEDGRDLGISLCSPAAMLDTDRGRDLFDQAVAAFGGVAPPEATPAPTDAAPVATSPTPAEPVPADPAATARDTTGIMVGAAVVAASLALFAALAIIARGQRRGSA